MLTKRLLAVCLMLLGMIAWSPDVAMLTINSLPFPLFFL